MQFKRYIFVLLVLLNHICSAQIKILFDATKAQSAGNADWVVDANTYNISYSTGNPIANSGGSEANPSRYPTPAQSGVTATTVETFWKGGLSAWGIEAAQAGYQVETLPIGTNITYGNSSNAQDLSNYDVFIVVEPNILFTSTEKTAILQFVFNGGGLMIVGNHNGSDRNNDGYDSPQVWNDLMTNNSVQANPFGFVFDVVSITQTSTNVMNNATSDPVMNGSFGQVTQMQYAAGNTMTMNTSNNPNVKGLIYKTGSAKGNTNVMALRSQFGAGRIVAIADSSPCDDGTGDTNDTLYDGWYSDASGNHRIFLMNATSWLVQGAVLPIELLDFSGKASEKGNILKWKIEKTTTLKEICIERAEKNSNLFEKINHIEVDENDYSSEYLDLNPLQSALYRLKFVENDDAISYSKIIAINRNFEEPSITLKGKDLFISPISQNATMTLYSIDGKKVQVFNVQKNKEEQTIDISFLEKNNYILVLQGENAILLMSKKLVIR